MLVALKQKTLKLLAPMAILTLAFAALTAAASRSSRLSADARTLPARGRVYSHQLPGSADNEALLGIAVDGHGTVWVSDQSNDSLLAFADGRTTRRVSLGSGALRDIENRASDVWTVGAVYVAPDRSVYVAERGALARLQHGRLRTYRIASGRYGSPGAFAGGRDGSVWFTEVNRPFIGRFSPGTGRITQFRDGTAGRGMPAGGIASGPDGRLWYTLPGYYILRHSELGAITTAGRAQVYRPAADGLLQAAWGIVSARGSLWVLGSRLGAAPRGQPGSELLRITPEARGPLITSFGPNLGDAQGELTLSDEAFYAVGGALGASGNAVSVSESGALSRYGRANGQVHLFGAGANITPLAGAADGTVWLGAADGVLEHLVPSAPEPCVVPRAVGYATGSARARLRHDHCRASIGDIHGPTDTPAIVTAQALPPGTLLNPDSAVRLTARRGIPYACDPSDHNSDPELLVLRINCRSALALYRRVYGRAVRRGSAVTGGFRCSYVRGTAIQGMGGGEVACRAHDHRGRRRIVEMYYDPPR